MSDAAATSREKAHHRIRGMKALLDSCVRGGVRDALLAAGHDVVWTGDWAEDPGDDEILALAHREGRALVTLDKDFGRLLFLMNRNSSGSPRGESGR